MTKSPSSNDQKIGLKKGPWTPEEDQKLIDYIQNHGHGKWRTLPKNAGLKRCGKSCRLRWTNYLRPDIKRGRFSFEEEETIIQLHSVLGNKWSTIAASLPGRTDNEIKNYWNTHIKKRLLKMGIDPVTHTPCLDFQQLSSILNSPLYNSISSSSLSSPQILPNNINNNNYPPLFGMGSNNNNNILNPSLLSLLTALLSSSSSSSQMNPNLQNQVESQLPNYPSSHQSFQLPNYPHQVENQATHFSSQNSVIMPSLENQIVQSQSNNHNNFNLGALLSNYSTPSSSTSPSTLNSSASSTAFVNGNSTTNTNTTEDERDTYCSNMLMYNISNGFGINDSGLL